MIKYQKILNNLYFANVDYLNANTKTKETPFFISQLACVPSLIASPNAPLIQIIASHIIKVHASADAASGDTRTSKEENWLKRYKL